MRKRKTVMVEKEKDTIQLVTITPETPNCFAHIITNSKLESNNPQLCKDGQSGENERVATSF